MIRSPIATSSSTSSTAKTATRTAIRTRAMLPVSIPKTCTAWFQTWRSNAESEITCSQPGTALLSFLYTLLLADCCAAVESVGLDPQIGFLHSLRPGRPALGLDLVEEFRSIVADRLALTLINRRQPFAGAKFTRPGGGAVSVLRGRSSSASTRRIRVTAVMTRGLNRTRSSALALVTATSMTPAARRRMFSTRSAMAGSRAMSG